MKVLFIDTENEIKDIDNFKDFDVVYLLNPSNSWKDTDKVKTTYRCYATDSNYAKFPSIYGEVVEEVGSIDDYKIITSNEDSFFIRVPICEIDKLLVKRI